MVVDGLTRGHTLSDRHGPTDGHSEGQIKRERERARGTVREINLKAVRAWLCDLNPEVSSGSQTDQLPAICSLKYVAYKDICSLHPSPGEEVSNLEFSVGHFDSQSQDSLDNPLYQRSHSHPH